MLTTPEKRPRFFWLSVTLILLVSLGLRIWELGEASLWTDEVLSEIRAQSTPADAIDSLLDAGNQTPLYYTLLRVVPDNNQTALRLPSALLGVLGTALLIFVAIQLYQNYHLALWAGALLAVNPFHVWLSRTARPYVLLFALSLLASYFFLMLLRGKRGRSIWAGFIISSMLMYLTHYSSVALPVAQFGVLIFNFRDKRSLILRWVGAQAAASIPLSVWLLAFLQHAAERGGDWVPIPHLADLFITLWSMTVGYDGSLNWYVVPGLFTVVAGLSAGVTITLWRARRNPDNTYWLLLILAPLVPVFVMSVVYRSIYVDRYFMVFLPALLILILIGWQGFPRPAARAALLLLIVGSIAQVVTSFNEGSYERADWEGVADYISAEYEAGDTVMVERFNTRYAFSRYLTTDARAAMQIIELDDATPGDSARLWVVYRNPIEDIHRQGEMPDFDPFAADLSPMGDWLIPRRESVLMQRSFVGVTILLLENP